MFKQKMLLISVTLLIALTFNSCGPSLDSLVEDSLLNFAVASGENENSNSYISESCTEPLGLSIDLPTNNYIYTPEKKVAFKSKNAPNSNVPIFPIVSVTDDKYTIDFIAGEYSGKEDTFTGPTIVSSVETNMMGITETEKELEGALFDVVYNDSYYFYTGPFPVDRAIEGVGGFTNQWLLIAMDKLLDKAEEKSFPRRKRSVLHYELNENNRNVLNLQKTFKASEVLLDSFIVSLSEGSFSTGPLEDAEITNSSRSSLTWTTNDIIGGALIMPTDDINSKIDDLLGTINRLSELLKSFRDDPDHSELSINRSDLYTIASLEQLKQNITNYKKAKTNEKFFDLLEALRFSTNPFNIAINSCETDDADKDYRVIESEFNRMAYLTESILGKDVSSKELTLSLSKRSIPDNNTPNITASFDDSTEINIKKLLAVTLVANQFLLTLNDGTSFYRIVPKDRNNVSTFLTLYAKLISSIDDYLEHKGQSREALLPNILSALDDISSRFADHPIRPIGFYPATDPRRGLLHQHLDKARSYFDFIDYMGAHLFDNTSHPLPELPVELFDECNTKDDTVPQNDKCLSYTLYLVGLESIPINPVQEAEEGAGNNQDISADCLQTIDTNINSTEEGNLLYKPNEPIYFKAKESYNNILVQPVVEVVDDKYKITFNIGPYDTDDLRKEEVLIGPIKIKQLDLNVLTNGSIHTLTDNIERGLVTDSLIESIAGEASLYQVANDTTSDPLEDITTRIEYNQEDTRTSRDFLTGLKITFSSGRFTKDGIDNYDRYDHTLEWTIGDIDIDSSNDTNRVKRAPPGTNPVVSSINLLYLTDIVDYIIFIIKSSLDREYVTYSEDIPLPLTIAQGRDALCTLESINRMIYSIMIDAPSTSPDEAGIELRAMAKNLCDKFYQYRYGRTNPQEKTMIKYVQRIIKYLRSFIKYLYKARAKPAPFAFTMFPELAPSLPDIPPQYYGNQGARNPYQDAEEPNSTYPLIKMEPIIIDPLPKYHETCGTEVTENAEPGTVPPHVPISKADTATRSYSKNEDDDYDPNAGGALAQPSNRNNTTDDDDAYNQDNTRGKDVGPENNHDELKH